MSSTVKFMPIPFYIHSKCVNDASHQHLPWIIFTASKQQTNVCSSDKNSIVEAFNFNDQTETSGRKMTNIYPMPVSKLESKLS